MNLRKQKQLAARTLGISPKRVKFNVTNESKKDLKELISREGVKELLEEKSISKTSAKGNSRTRANFILSQKKKGRRQGHGNRKGTANARFGEKDRWMIKIRALRNYLKNLKDSGRIDNKTYRELYLKAKGNFFRNKRHVLIYAQQNNLFIKREEVENEK